MQKNKRVLQSSSFRPEVGKQWGQQGGYQSITTKNIAKILKFKMWVQANFMEHQPFQDLTPNKVNLHQNLKGRSKYF